MAGYGSTRYVPMSFYDSLADARKTLKENSLTALEFQTELMEWLGRETSKAAYADLMRSYGYTRSDEEAQRQELGGHLHRSVQSVISTASTFYVSPDMCELVKMAATDMPASGLLPTDLPTDTGFLVFDRPLSITQELPVYDDDNVPHDTTSEIRIAAIAWQAGTVRRAPATDGSGRRAGFVTTGATAPGVSYYLFTTPYDTAVNMNQIADLLGEAPDQTEDDVRRYLGPLPLYDYSGWVYNQPWFATDTEEGYAVEEGDQEPMAGVHSSVDQMRRLLLAVWRILGQTNIVVLDSNGAPRQLRRRAQRTGIIPEDGDILIIRMRREIYQGLTQAAGGDDEPWYTCRFLVRGHWHNYWVGPRGQQHLVPKYILPYEKGPEGAPLVRKDKIGSLER
jgi:hypothetical protein